MKKVLFAVTVLLISLTLFVGAFAETRYSVDGVHVNESKYIAGEYADNPVGEALSTVIEMTEGDKLYCLGWFADPDYAVDRLVYRIDEETEYECEDNYRDRCEIYDIREQYNLTWVDELGFEHDDFIKSGFGKDDNMMEMTGIDKLPAGEYYLELVGKFVDGEEYVLKAWDLFIDERPLNLRDFNAETDKQYFDQILINGELKANGNDEVAALKANIDGSDGSVKTISMFGWFGAIDTEKVFKDELLGSFGYIIDDGKPVFDQAFTVADTEAAVLEGNGMRYSITVDVSGIEDGKTHVIKGCVKLTNGDLVIFNRENREAIVNYTAPLAATPEPTEEPTQAPTQEPTQEPAAPTEAASEPTAAAEQPTEAPKKTGCGNVIGGGIAIIALAAVAVFLRKKEF